MPFLLLLACFASVHQSQYYFTQPLLFHKLQLVLPLCISYYVTHNVPLSKAVASLASLYESQHYVAHIVAPS